MPSVSLPKGGGAIRGMGEKFAANPVTGTGSLSVPIPVSPGRSGFGPQLSLSYDSGAGNGPFGIGWALSLPSITRKTDKGLPSYDDANESDVFVLSGAEDLVPLLEPKPDSTNLNEYHWIPYRDPGNIPSAVEGRDEFDVRRYRPRIEGLFARIELWTNRSTSEVHWRSITKDNVTSIYGWTNESRIERLSTDSEGQSTFSWLICQSFDDKGNVVVYRYKSEDSTKVDKSAPQERNRSDSRSTNRYLKSVYYGNRLARSSADFKTGLENPDQIFADPAKWTFEVVFDFGEHDSSTPEPSDNSPWPHRRDAFSSYRAGFEVRNQRLCQRVMMFHHFPNEAGVGTNCLVRSLDMEYQINADKNGYSVGSFVNSITQRCYKRKPFPATDYLTDSLPKLEFEYSQVAIDEGNVFELDTRSLDNLPAGLGSGYRWVDLDGEGLSGVLTEQAGAWFYKRNTAANNLQPFDDNGHKRSRAVARFAPVELVMSKPNTSLGGGQVQLLDLAGDGQLDVVELDGPVRGFYERTDDGDWETFRAFQSYPNLNTRDPNLKFVDLNGDGHSDILISEDDVFTWYPSLAEEGFGPSRRVHHSFDDEKGPRVVFADASQTIFLADMSGDGLTDVVRITCSNVCYWPNLGYSRFGAKVTMDNSPCLDYPDSFDPKRIRLVDIDGSGVTDIIYLHQDGVRIYLNQSGNAWATEHQLKVFPHVDNIVDIQVTDLLGNGTACLVWSSPLPGDFGRQMRYLDLMSGNKPHLLTRVVNNLGAETRIHYTTSTKFYLDDKDAGRPWITRLPFPVHVVEKVETIDRISRHRFVTRHAYHHGYFDGDEREFRGFGMVEQWDTDQQDFVAPDAEEMTPENESAASYVSPIHTKTWFHNGAFSKQAKISGQYEHEYWHEPGLSDGNTKKMLLEDTHLPNEIRIGNNERHPYPLTGVETREACRALKGSILRQEIYADDGTLESNRPYSVSERNYTLEILQPRADNEHAVFFVHPRETIDFHYERKLYELRNADDTIKKSWFDPRVTHGLTLAVDDFGNVKQSVAVAYGRRATIEDLKALAKLDGIDTVLQDSDYEQQQRTLLTLTENSFTNSVVTPFHVYRAPLPTESATYELVQKKQMLHPPGLVTTLLAFSTIQAMVAEAGDGNHDLKYEDFLHAGAIKPVDDTQPPQTYRRPIEHVQTRYRSDDLTGLLGLHTLESLAIPGESYKMAFTPGLLEKVYQRTNPAGTPEALLPSAAVDRAKLFEQEGGYRQDTSGNYWIPSGRSYFSPSEYGDPEPTLMEARQELDEATTHFFLPRRFRDPFGTSSFVAYEQYDLMVAESSDALGNRVAAEDKEVLPGGLIRTRPTIDYRVLQPHLNTDPNGNRTAVFFDTMGMVAGTAVMGKFTEKLGDSLDGFAPDLASESDAESKRKDFFETPRLPSGAFGLAVDLLGKATTRIVYDLHRFAKTRKDNPNNPEKWEPNYAATIVRETHESDLLGLPAETKSKVQVSFSYSDGFGREIQKKIQAEAGPLDLNDPSSPKIDPRWVGSGWTIFNNKGKPVRQYEPFFSKRQRPDGTLFSDHRFEFGMMVGVTSTLFYDPADRVVATLHPNHTWEKIVFDPWQQASWDVNDTIKLQPQNDPDVGVYFQRLARAEGTSGDFLPTWHETRTIDTNAEAQWPGSNNERRRKDEKSAATKAEKHAATPSRAFMDTLGRSFLTIAHNRTMRAGTSTDEFYPTRVEFDMEGNQRSVRDAKTKFRNAAGIEISILLGRVVMKYDYDMLGNRIHQASMEAGERWMLNDATGKPIRAWDSRQHTFRTEYDLLHRPVRSFVLGANPSNAGREYLVERTIYGEQHPEREARNLRGKVFQHFDQAGVVSTDGYDFKGNSLENSRQLASDYKGPVDWKSVDVLIPGSSRDTDPMDSLTFASLTNEIRLFVGNESFSGTTEFDALNRPKRIIAPHSDRPGTKLNTIWPTFNNANFLDKVEVNLNGETAKTIFVQNIDYDAKGQRTRIELGAIGDRPNAITEYTHDPLTFRLLRLSTIRQRPMPTDDPNVQDLHYCYDPAGNITNIRDDAKQTIYFNNRIVDPNNDYIYDSIYRLIQAKGREHLGQSGTRLTDPKPHETLQTLPHSNDGNAMGSYTETYDYDQVGNFNFMKHTVDGPPPASGLPSKPEWKRQYFYEFDSQIDPSVNSNRLTSTKVEAGLAERYEYDLHGNMTRMPHLSVMQWDHRDQLHATAKQIDNTSGVTPPTTYYVYDSTGERMRKVTDYGGTDTVPAMRKNERIYLGIFEVFREYDGASVEPQLERETLHVMDDKQRVAIVETKIKAPFGDSSPDLLVRYQFSNHLGSASLELGDNANLISYEEYFPYGNTSFQLMRSGLESNPKRYRFTGKERDEESGLCYHSARYYASWLGKWTACDPAGTSAGLNLFSYCHDSPTRFNDQNGTTPFEPSKERLLGRFEKWLLYRNNTPILDAITSNKNLQNVETGIAVGTVATLVTLGTGGAATAVLGATTFEAGVIGGAAGGVSSAFHGSAIEGGLPTTSEVSASITFGAVSGGGLAAIESKIIPAIVARTIPKPNVILAATPATPAAHIPARYPNNPRSLPVDPQTGERLFDAWQGGMLRATVRPGGTSDGINQSLRRRFQSWSVRNGTIDGPATTPGNTVVGHVEGQAHVLSPEGSHAQVAPQTVSGNQSWISAEKQEAALRRAWNAAHPDAPQLPVRPIGQRRN